MAYMTAAEMRDRYPALAADQADITTEMLEEYIAEFEELAERYRGVAYEPRTTTETVEVTCSGRFLLSHVMVTAIDEITIDGEDVADYTFTDGYSVTFTAYQYGTLSVTYTHGFASPPPGVLKACREYVLSTALQDRSSVTRDAVSSTDGGYTIKYSTPNWEQGRPTGYLEVDAALNSLEDHRFTVVA